ncbi:HEPN domain-containing protein [Sulfuracidifex tepidarius]|uniref:HEPN domain-containing protein n=1 Tax=Sulfuracidifex tepidarius TaxID=1294262 RepID=UPI000AFF8D42|nr:HEPN domain-containing protein [Sulfuracidifex tepidarius]
MNNSEIASEYILRTNRTLKEAKMAFDDGDLLYTAIRLYESVENMSKALLSLYGIYSKSSSGNAVSLEYLKRDKDLDEKTKEVISKLQEIEAKLFPSTVVDESSLKTPSVVIRHKEAEIIMNEITSLFDKINVIFDEFHN